MPKSAGWDGCQVSIAMDPYYLTSLGNENWGVCSAFVVPILVEVAVPVWEGVDKNKKVICISF